MISIFTTSQDSSLLCNGCAFIASQSFQAMVPYPLLDQLLWNIGFPHAGCTSNPQTMAADPVIKQNVAKEIKDAEAPTASCRLWPSTPWHLWSTSLPTTLFLSFTRAIATDSTFLHCYIQANLQALGCLASLANHTRTGKLHTAQIVLFSVVFGTNPFGIVFNSKPDVNLSQNLLVT